MMLVRRGLKYPQLRHCLAYGSGEVNDSRSLSIYMTLNSWHIRSFPSHIQVFFHHTLFLISELVSIITSYSDPRGTKTHLLYLPVAMHSLTHRICALRSPNQSTLQTSESNSDSNRTEQSDGNPIEPFPDPQPGIAALDLELELDFQPTPMTSRYPELELKTCPRTAWSSFASDAGSEHGWLRRW